MYKLLLAIFISIFIIPTSYADKPAPKKWTFIIFMNGNNNLDPFSTYNLKQLEKVGSTADINVVVQWASMSAGKAVRMKIEKSTDSRHVTSPVLQDLGEVDMGDYQTLEDFIKWSVTNYPADHYFVDVWNHGSGWSLKGSHVINKDISEDEISGNVIKTEQLGKVLDDVRTFIGRKIDIYGSDACLMGMIEVAKQVSSATNYFIGSQALEPADGWPYDTFLARWAAKPDMTSQEIATTLGSEFLTYYKAHDDGDGGVTYAAYDLSKITSVESAIADLGSDLRQLTQNDVKLFLDATKHAQRFDSGVSFDYGDIVDLMQKLKSKKIKAIKPELIDAVISASQKFVIANYTTPDYKRANGVSIWLPVRYTDVTGDERSKRYRGLPFDQDTHWADTMTYLLHRQS